MTKKQITKLSDKLAKASDSLTVNIYDNGFMVEIGGRDHTDDWKSAKIMCNTIEDVFKVITDAAEMERD